MAIICKYSVLRLMPDSRRGETINIGLVLFVNGHTSVRVLPSMRKAQALDANIDIDRLYGLPNEISEWVVQAESAEDAHLLLKNFGGISVSDLGWFSVTDDTELESKVSGLMKTLVVPPSRMSARVWSTRLQSELKRVFDKRGILGRHDEEINNHKIIHHYPVTKDGSLFVDFALKNGRFHVTETVDFRVSSESIQSMKMKEVGLKAVTLDQSVRNFGEETRRYFIYAASSATDKQITSHLNLISDYADRVLNFASAKDRAFYVDEIMASVSPDMLSVSSPKQIEFSTASGKPRIS